MRGERGIMCRFDPENPWGFTFSAGSEGKLETAGGHEPFGGLVRQARVRPGPALHYETVEFSVTLVRLGRVNREGHDCSL
jgi:hypothetical protein